MKNLPSKFKILLYPFQLQAQNLAKPLISFPIPWIKDNPFLSYATKTSKNSASFNLRDKIIPWISFKIIN